MAKNLVSQLEALIRSARAAEMAQNAAASSTGTAIEYNIINAANSYELMAYQAQKLAMQLEQLASEMRASADAEKARRQAAKRTLGQ